MKTYRVTISYSDNGKPLVFTRHIPVFAAGKDGPAAAKGAAMLAYCSEIRLPISKITGIDVCEDPFTCLADCESIEIPEEK